MLLQDRAEKIAKASEELEKGEITGAIFLNRMTYPDMRICRNLDEFSTVDDPRIENDNYDLNEEEENNDVQVPNQSCDANVIKLMPCCVCLDNISQITMVPCGHLKVCTDCWQIIITNHDEKMAKFIERELDEEYRPRLKCPFCNVPIDNYLNKTFA